MCFVNVTSKMDVVGTVMVAAFIVMCLYLFWMWFCFGTCVIRRQKTRTQQQRRMYGSSRTRPPTDHEEPTIFVSPANLPPPPKYEALAPPSYEEAVAVNYQEFQRTQAQPITFPLTHAAIQSCSSAANNPTNVTSNEELTPPPAVVTVTTVDERRTSVAQS
ncbi:uncharacterized protein LOC131855431 [Achroia grisella]|uniref:uncharacterized protein LOC131855431 n=1 Tax=Achroia grisella TaxID=688607 RepID=UPI0027D2C9FE|nr:uncharacterized protein LOC131855431 [Achroia grisella]